MMYLERLMEKYPSIRHNVYWLKALLITLEILPILAKLSSPYGVYDAVLETNEQTQIHLQKETLRANKIQIERDAEREQQYRETLSQKVYAELLAASVHHLKVVLHDLEKSVEFEARRADLTAEMADRITDTIKDTMTPPALPETSLSVREPASGTLSIREILDQMIRKNSI
ncbi:hypothetical protein NIES4073_03160 (plasmid) [Kalymmatonema gypsitolerans NIES-4073]|nr:hypothetical protein NIES4073_03160 [Scytonema sp. NIES-4073]